VKQLAATMELTPGEVADALAPATVASLDGQTDNRGALSELVPSDAAGWPEAQAIDHEQARAVRVALQHLRGRKHAIVSRHFGLDGAPETLTEIASDLSLSPERTRALKDEALRELAAELAPAGVA
jgi:DNA-directed RNA polymerase sigma subunit (sigma70/sigma32)